MAGEEESAVVDGNEAELAKFVGFATKDGERIVPDAEPAPKTKPVVMREPEAAPEDDQDDNKTSDEPKRSAQERINRAVGRQRAAEREAEAHKSEVASLTARLEALERCLTKPESKAKVDPDAPSPKDYTYGDMDPKFTADLARYETRKTIAEDRAAQTRSQETAQQTKDRAAFDHTVSEFSTKGAAKYEDFEDLVVQGAQRQEWELSPTLGPLLLDPDSEFGIDIAHQLASDPTEAKRISKLTPARQAAWFGKMEAKFEAESPKSEGADQDDEPRKLAQNGRKMTQAPAPLRHQTRGTGSSGTSPGTSDFAAFEAMVTGKR